MNRRNPIFNSSSASLPRQLLSAALLLSALWGSGRFGLAQEPGQRTFSSPGEAAQAFFAASRSQDNRGLLAILGPEGKEVISSGDSTEDAASRRRFTEKYEEMHRFAPEPDGSLTLFVGAENWPLPIPLVNRQGAWHFDTTAGKNEILFRRIGRNELAAMDACLELVQAEQQYFLHPPDGMPNQYAKKFLSDANGRDGLYQEGRLDTPLDPLIAYAFGKGPGSSVGDQAPYNGYFLRILTGQGAHATGGAKSYVVDGKMTGGFAFVAYPAEYRSSGVMTFIVNQDGSIYERDLGPNTKETADAMTQYDPDSNWEKVPSD